LALQPFAILVIRSYHHSGTARPIIIGILGQNRKPCLQSKVFGFEKPPRDPTGKMPVHGRPAHVRGDSFQNKRPWPAKNAIGFLVVAGNEMVHFALLPVLAVLPLPSDV
jgi:hypothetical protein